MFIEVLQHGFYKEYEKIIKDKENLLLCKPEFKMKIDDFHIEKVDRIPRASFNMKIHRKLYVRRKWWFKDATWRDDDFTINIKVNNLPCGYLMYEEKLELTPFNLKTLDSLKLNGWSIEVSATGRAFDRSTGERCYSWIFSDFLITINPANLQNILKDDGWSESGAIFRILNVRCPIEYLDNVQGIKYLDITKKEYSLPIKNRTFLTSELNLQMSGNVPDGTQIKSFFVVYKDEHIKALIDWDTKESPKILNAKFMSFDKPIEIGEKCIFDFVIWYANEPNANRFVVRDLVVNFVKG